VLAAIGDDQGKRFVYSLQDVMTALHERGVTAVDAELLCDRKFVEDLLLRNEDVVGSDVARNAA